MTSRAPSAPRFRPEESFARQLDDDDPLASYRERFRFPTRQDGRPVRYFCGNSLGLQPSATPVAVERELDAWARFAVDAHFAGDAPWYDYHALLREPSARLVGAHPDEVVVMNSLTVNLHLMLVSFYRPTSGRDKILMEDCAFPSDTYAVKSQLVFHGRDPADALIVARGSDGRPTVPTDELEHVLDRHGEQIALVFLGDITITLDCDVLQADGGTRTAAISGSYVALAMAIEGRLASGGIAVNPLHGQVAAVSVGIWHGIPVLDLDYAEDSTAETDMNVVMKDAVAFVEIQGTAEGHAFRRDELDALLDLAAGGIQTIQAAQNEALESARAGA